MVTLMIIFFFASNIGFIYVSATEQFDYEQLLMKHKNQRDTLKNRYTPITKEEPSTPSTVRAFSRKRMYRRRTRNKGAYNYDVTNERKPKFPPSNITTTTEDGRDREYIRKVYRKEVSESESDDRKVKRKRRKIERHRHPKADDKDPDKSDSHMYVRKRPMKNYKRNKRNMVKRRRKTLKEVQELERKKRALKKKTIDQITNVIADILEDKSKMNGNDWKEVRKKLSKLRKSKKARLEKKGRRKGLGKKKKKKDESDSFSLSLEGGTSEDEDTDSSVLDYIDQLRLKMARRNLPPKNAKPGGFVRGVYNSVKNAVNSVLSVPGFLKVQLIQSGSLRTTRDINKQLLLMGNETRSYNYVYSKTKHFITLPRKDATLTAPAQKVDYLIKDELTSQGEKHFKREITKSVKPSKKKKNKKRKATESDEFDFDFDMPAEFGIFYRSFLVALESGLQNMKTVYMELRKALKEKLEDALSEYTPKNGSTLAV